MILVKQSMQIRFLRVFPWALIFTATLLIANGGLPGRATVSSAIPVEATATYMATAAGPPRLVTEILNGQPISVLYVTRSEDRVLVRCYPEYLPGVQLRAMGSDPDRDNGPQEGVLSCTPQSEMSGAETSS